MVTWTTRSYSVYRKLDRDVHQAKRHITSWRTSTRLFNPRWCNSRPLIIQGRSDRGFTYDSHLTLGLGGCRWTPAFQTGGKALQERR